MVAAESGYKMRFSVPPKTTHTPTFKRGGQVPPSVHERRFLRRRVGADVDKCHYHFAHGEEVRFFALKRGTFRGTDDQ